MPSARPINAGIWRYHPTRHVFEVFAHGTSNPWGIDFDARGQMIITACVIPHLYHMIQGGRYERQAGQHFNPYTYDDIKTIADHRHYLGANPHGGNGRSDSAGGGHAHSGAMIYLGGAWPAEYQRLAVHEQHPRGPAQPRHPQAQRLGLRRLARPRLPAGQRSSGRRSSASSTGPTAALFMIDWYDKNQCHHNDVNGHDRTNGRIFKVSYGETKALERRSRASRAARRWSQLQTFPNEWHARHARRILQERGPSAEVSRLLQELEPTTRGSAGDPASHPAGPACRGRA